MEASKAIGQKIIDLGNRFAKADNCGEKNTIAGELATLIKYDLGGVVFMSNKVNDIVDNGGLLPGTSAVISSAVSKKYISHHQIPMLSDDDLEMYIQTIVVAINMLHSRISEAELLLRKRAANNLQLEAMTKASLTGTG
jgi:hypothetical protein